ASIDAAAEQIGKLGAKVEEVTLPDWDLFNACGRVILACEAYAIHEENFRKRPLDYAAYTYMRMVPAVSLTAPDLVQAFRLRRELATTVNEKILGAHDAIITASGLSPAPRFDEYDP